MASLDRGIMYSRPHEVRFAGWSTDTYQLQRAGWRLSADQDPVRGVLRLVMKLDKCRLYMLAEDVRVDFRGYHMGSWWGRPELEFCFEVRHAFTDAVIHSNMDFSRFSPIDAEPTFSNEAPKSIRDFNIFAAPLVRTEEIIVEPQSVAECLELIKKMQAPELAQIRERNRRREMQAAGEPLPQQRFHAQILSLAA